MELSYFLALITFFGWGTGDIFTIESSRRIGANLTTFFTFTFSFLLSLCVLPFVPLDIGKITLPLLTINIVLGIIYILGNVLVSEAFRISSAPLVGIIIQAFPAVVLILSVVVYGDVVAPIQWIYIGVIFLGVFLCSVDLALLRNARKIIDRGTGLALIAMVLFSLFFTLSRSLIELMGWFLPTFIATSCFPIILIFMKRNKESFHFPKSKFVLFSTFMTGLLIRAGDFALNYGLTIPGGSNVVAPIAGASPILFVILSSFIFKDKISKQQVIGIITTLVGILLLTLSTSGV